MPLQGDILSSSFAPQIRNYDNSTGSVKMKGGVTEFIQAEYEVRVFWYAEPSNFDIFGGGQEIKRNDGGNFFTDGFQVGEDISIEFGFGGSGQSAAGTITAISEDGSTLFTTIGTLTNGSYDQSVECLIAAVSGVSDFTEAIYQFGLIENNETFNTFSKLTGEEQGYYVSDMTVINDPKFGEISGNQKGWASEFESLIIIRRANSDIPINRPPDFGGPGGTPVSNSALNYTIRHRFPVLPYYVVGQLQNIKDLVSPSFLAGKNSLKHVFECTFKKNLTDEESTKTVKFESLQGSIGFFNEQFNGFQSQYSVESVAYEVVSTTLPNDSLLVGEPTKVTAVIKSDDGTFGGGTKVIATHSYLPENEEEYLDSQDYFDENFAFQNTPNGAGGSIITSVTLNVVDPNTLEVNIIVDVSNVKPDLTSDSNYLLALTVENEALTQDNSDRTVLLLDVNTYDQDPDIPDLFLVDEAVTYDHVTDVNNTGFTDYKGWVQDGYATKGMFRLDRSKFAFLSELFIELVAWKDGTNEYFTIQSNSYNLTGAVIDGDGNQQIDIDTTQGFLLDELDQFNQKLLVTGNFDGTFISYAFLMGLKINWQDWLSLPNADSVFVDTSEPNNGLNQNSSRYSLKEGYTLQTILRANVLETVQNVTTQYIHKIPMVVNAFEEDATEDWEATIATKIDETLADANGTILGSGQSTRIVATFTPQFALTPDPNDFEGVIRIVEQLPQGEKTIYELSSIRSSQPNNLLIPLDGESLTKVSVVGGSVVLECRTDETLIQDVNYTVSARLYGPAAVVVGDFNDDFSNDFFV